MNISDTQVILAYRIAELLRDHPQPKKQQFYADELLRVWTSEPENIIRTAMERSVDNGYIEYSVSLRAGWITGLPEQIEGLRQFYKPEVEVKLILLVFNLIFRLNVRRGERMNAIMYVLCSMTGQTTEVVARAILNAKERFVMYTMMFGDEGLAMLRAEKW